MGVERAEVGDERGIVFHREQDFIGPERVRAVHEAFLAGVPVIAGDRGGMAEYVEHGVTGFLRRPGDWRGVAEDLERLSDDPSLCARMGTAAREYIAKHFDPDVEYGGLVEGLAQLGLEGRAARVEGSS